MPGELANDSEAHKNGSFLGSALWAVRNRDGALRQKRSCGSRSGSEN